MRITACFVSWLFFVGLSTHALAQNAFELLLGSKGSQLQIQTPGSEELQMLRQQLTQLKAQIQQWEQVDTKQKALLEKEMRRNSEQSRQYSSTQYYAQWQGTPSVLQRQSQVLHWLNLHTALNDQLRFSYDAYGQSLQTLYDTTQQYLELRQNAKSWLQQKATSFQKQGTVKQALQAIRLRRQELKKQLTINKNQVAELKTQLEENSEQVLRIQQKMLGSLLKQQIKQSRLLLPTPAKVLSKTTTRPSTRKAKVSKHTQPPRPVTSSIRKDKSPSWWGAPMLQQPPPWRIAQELEHLRSFSQRLSFRFFRARNKLLSLNYRDARLNRQVLKRKERYNQWLAASLTQYHKKRSQRRKGGIWYRVHFQVALKDFSDVIERSTALWKKAQGLPTQLHSTWDRISKDQRQRWRSGFWLLFALWILSGLAFGYTCAMVMRWGSRTLGSYEEKSLALKQLWQGFKLLLDLLRGLWPVLVIVLWLGLLGFFLNFSSHLTKNFWLVVWQLSLFWFLWLSANLLFPKEFERSLFQHIPKEEYQGLRRVARWSSGTALLTLPLLSLLSWANYPPNIIQNLWLLVVTSFFFYSMLLLRRKTAVLSLIPAQTWLGGPLTQLLNKIYPLLYLSLCVLYVMYVSGYTVLAGSIVWSTVFTVLVLSGAYSTYRASWLFSLWGFGFSKESQGVFQVDRRWARNLVRFIRMLVGFLLSVLSFIVLLRVWGVIEDSRVAFKIFTYPFVRVQKTQITLISLFQLILVVVLSVWFTRWSKQRLSRYVYPAIRVAPSNQHAINTIIGYLILSMGFLGGLQWIGVGVSVLAVFAGVLGIGIGFGLQNIANNFISGLIITFSQPIKVNDLIEVSGEMGLVREINARSTTIETFDCKIILIPNSDILTNRVTNWSLGPPHIYAKLAVGVAYGSDVALVHKTLEEIALSHKAVLKQPPPMIRFGEFGPSSLDFSLWIAVTDPMERFAVLSDLRYKIDARFKELNIVIAFPQQDVHFDADFQETLVQGIIAKTQASPESTSPPATSLQSSKTSQTPTAEEQA